MTFRLGMIHAAFLALILVAPLPSNAATTANQLTESEKQSGWRLLFDGESTAGWRNYQQDAVSSGWQIENGELTRVSKGAGDLITEQQYQAFELQLEYKISAGGNSGLMFHVTEEAEQPWQTGPEIQIQDDIAGHDPEKSGWLYQLYKPQEPGWAARMMNAEGIDPDKLKSATRPAGKWNHLYVRISPNRSQVCMNGVNYIQFKKGTDDWNERVEKSKFAKFEKFGKAEVGHICLQDHGNEVAFRNIKIRTIGENSKVTNPIHGSIPLVGKPAFPNLKWEGWEGNLDDGKKHSLRTIVLQTATAPGTSDGQAQVYTASQTGMIHSFKNDSDATVAQMFLDLRDRVKSFREPGANEEGLLGLAFHPDYTTNGRFFVYYTSAHEDKTSIVSEFSVSAETGEVDPTAERTIMKIQQPFMNHNGGCIEFGPDGYLYIGMGDGGMKNDPFKAGQDLSTQLGKILRIDINEATTNADAPYGIPADNPFVDREGALPAIYAYGLRNVWRMSFDQANGDLWAADVGQELWEEINVIQKGGNYGWSEREGAHNFGGTPSSENANFIEPIWEYDHQIGKSITGGHVYRGSRIPELIGKYIYADYVSGRIWALEYDAQGTQATQNYGLIDGGQPVLAFGQDDSGEVYYMIESNSGQTIHRFEKE